MEGVLDIATLIIAIGFALFFVMMGVSAVMDSYR